MPSLLILNGPNLNLLGSRRPTIYGATTLADVEALCRSAGKLLGHEVDFRQSNHEGVLIDAIHEAGRGFKAGALTGVVFNARRLHAQLSCAIKGVDVPVIEVHISNVHAREPFRHHSWLSPVAAGIIVGFGVDGYVMAIEALVRRAAARKT